MRRAAIFDMDGTLADVRPIRHYVQGKRRNFDKFHKASIFTRPNAEAVALFRMLAADVSRVIVTARDARYERETVSWLRKYGLQWDALYMRSWGDQRPDYEVKADILRDIKADGYTPCLAVDDNPNVVKLWKQNDIPTVIIPGWGEEGDSD